jgi:hypothetical protein
MIVALWRARFRALAQPIYQVEPAMKASFPSRFKFDSIVYHEFLGLGKAAQVNDIFGIHHDVKTVSMTAIIAIGQWNFTGHYHS